MTIVALVSGLSFAAYGSQTLFGIGPRREFERLGVPGVRSVVGITQLLGSAGVLIGLWYTPIGVAAASGLMTMMVVALVFRRRIGDPVKLMVPAASLGLANAALIALFLIES